jgi:hypothetical protein
MSAPDYAARRSELAKENGRGRVPEKPVAAVPVQKIAAGVRGKKPRRLKAAAPDAEITPDISA